MEARSQLTKEGSIEGESLSERKKDIPERTSGRSKPGAMFSKANRVVKLEFKRIIENVRVYLTSL
jgi:hypothetical protein